MTTENPQHCPIFLFRAKTRSGEWLEGHPNFADPQNPRFFDLDGELHPIDPFTIGQYIGRVDKHLNRIFSGDICSHKYSKSHVLITWEDYGFVARIPYGSLVDIDDKSLEIIGNITDTPELLK